MISAVSALSSRCTDDLSNSSGLWFSREAKSRAFVSSLFGLALASLAACGGGGGGGVDGDDLRITPPDPSEVTGPDLIVENPTAPTTRVVGEDFVFTARFRNQGTDISAATIFRVYRSTDAIITTGDTEILDIALPPIEASPDPGVAQIPLPVPANAGTYYYGACIEAVTGEANTENNCSISVRVAVTATSEPNLIVEEPAAPATRIIRQRFSFSARVRNQGTASSAATTLTYYRSPDSTITTSDDAMGTDAIGTLDADAISNESITLTAPDSAGTYYYGACIEAVTGESDTENNCSRGVRISVTATPAPDLIVEEPTAPATRVVGQSFDFTARVKNQGTDISAATRLRYYRSNDATIDSGDTEVGTVDNVGTLAADSTSDQSIRLTAPATEGIYYYGACVEDVAGESDTENNCSRGFRVAASVPTPDLIVENPSAPATRKRGQSFDFTARIKNRGTDQSAPTNLRYYRSADAEITADDTEVGTAAAVGTLAADGTSNQSIRLTAPTLGGIYYYGACVEDVANESNTSNNCSIGVKVIVVAPDLIVEEFSMSHQEFDLTSYESLEAYARVKNQGISSSAETALRYYQSDDATIDSTDDTEIGTKTVGELAANATSRLDISLSDPTSTETYYYGACVDSVPDEADTSNNCSIGVKVIVLAPDFIVEAPMATPTTVTAGQSFTFSVRIKNEGTGDGEPSSLRYYQSDDAAIGSTDDTEVGSQDDSFFPKNLFLSPDGTSNRSIPLTAPTTAGTYYYGACVGTSVSSYQSTHCSVGVEVTVTAASP